MGKPRFPTRLPVLKQSSYRIKEPEGDSNSKTIDSPTRGISMRQITIRFLCCSILCLAGYTSYLFLSPASVFGADIESPVDTAPKVDHVLLEVSNLDASIAFYRDMIGLRLKSRSHGDVGIWQRWDLWSARWDWEKPRSDSERQGLGMYPHFGLNDAATVVEKAREAGYQIIQEPRKYNWGTEAFIAGPDGYTWAFVSPPK
jgi:catechol 2,3-dioxygenase-like lactoylglutathione lyase family enzyme